MRRRFLCALVVALSALASASCHHSSTSSPPSLEGAWLDGSDQLLLVIQGSDASFFYVAGQGSCIDQGITVTVVGSALQTPSGKQIPISVSGDTLTITDSTGSIAGAYSRASYAALCTPVVPAPGAMSARASVITPGPVTTIAGGDHARALSFAIPTGTVSFSLDLFGQDVAFDGLAFDVFASPSGSNLLAAESALEECFNGQCNVFLPKSPLFPPNPGTYTARISGPGMIDDASISVRLVVRPGPYTTPTVLRVHPIVGPTSTTDAEIQQALDGMQTFLDAHGLSITIDPITKLTDPAFAAPVADFLYPTTASLMSNGDPDAVNLFFCDDLVGLEGLFGEASGIPGSLGIVGPWNGVLLNLSQHRSGTSLETSLLVETMVHESGHLLGLYHTTERDGRTFDILDDTPECAIGTYDKDHDGYVLANECPDGDNVMFWTPSTSDGSVVVQDVLSPEQVGVISHAVIGE